MHLDHSKFVDLMVENSGQDREKVEAQIAELIADIKNAFQDGEGYEVEGFGVFSKLGNNVMFIPSEELETEINYKYAGMEPIELPDAAVEEEEPEESKTVLEENPIAGIMDAVDEEDYEDPFEELLNEGAEEEESSEDASDSEAGEEEEDPFALDDEEESGSSGEEAADQEEDEDETEAEEEEDEEHEADEEPVPFDLEALDEEGEDITEEAGEDDEDIDFSALEDHTEGEEKANRPGPESWGIDAHKEEGQESAFGGLIRDEDDAETGEKPDDEEELDFSALGVEGDPDDFDDPFDELEQNEEDDFVPVVTNVSSEKGEKAKEAESDSDSESKKKEKKKKKKKKTPRDRQSSPVLLYLVLILLILGGGGYAAAYFGYIDIPGITPETGTSTPQVVQNEPPATNTVPAEDPPRTTPQETPPAETEAQEEETPPQTDTDTTPQEQETTGEVLSTQPVTDNPETYGLMGDLSREGNNGYTIVLYSLSREAGAMEAFNRLKGQGYRAMVTEVPSSQYGVLYRVSVGQFESLISAADAVAENPDFFNGNYFITKIQ